jgi:para-nitrobenzyl esterase
MANNQSAAGSPFCEAATTGGRVLGLHHSGVNHFRGVPYGAPTGGEHRFRAPRPVVPWSGLRECFGHGQVSPQLPTPLTHRYGRLIHLDLATAEGGMGEDCLNLNLWTPALGDGGRRPVLFCIHGGGFAIGSANSPLYDGAELARRGNVVVVSANHRLGSLGFLNLRDLGASEEFAAAGSLGIRDLVLALEWVRDNAEVFGGDRGKVTVFGQSGGGWKTSVLLAAPAARGLIHRAAVQSGSLLRLRTREESVQSSAALLRELNLTPTTLTKLFAVPWQEIIAAQDKVGALNFAPVLDDDFLPHHPCDPDAPAESSDVPLIVSTVLDDASLFFDHFDLDEAGLRRWLQSRYPLQTDAILRLYRGVWPNAPPFLLFARIVTDSGFRRFAHLHAERKARLARAPVYCYRFDWTTPALGGLYGAAHATDVAASLGNHRDGIAGAGSEPGARLCDALSAAWVAFARDGDPNTPLLPAWPAFSLSQRATLIIDARSRIDLDPHAELRLFWEMMPPASSVFG